MEPGIYKHYKRGEYRVLGVGTHTETGEELVMYEQLYDAEDFSKGTIWVRSLKEFTDSVEVDGQTVPRFSLVRKF